MSQNRRKPLARYTPLVLMLLLGLALLPTGILPASQTVIARALSLSDDTTWLEMVDTPNQLYTEFPLKRLAGRLINFGAVDASACDNSGLAADGQATDCGLEAAKTLVYEWQNRFNPAIVAASKQENVPPRLLKNLFAWESQYWPETIFVNTFEFGLGHITLNGADSSLRWNPPLYDEICATSFSKELCAAEVYGYQSDAMRSSLQGVLVQKMNADCSNCRFNLDLDKAEDSIPYFAKALNANGAYVRYAINVFSGKQAEDLVSADDLWRFTLVAYNAGPGCYRTAIKNIYYRGFSLTWENLQLYLEPACRGSIPYVEFISSTDSYHPENDPALHPTATPEATLVPPTPTPVPVSLDVPHSEDELLVKISDENLDAALQTLAGLNIDPAQVSEPLDATGSRIIQVAPDQLTDVLSALQSDPQFTSVEPNYLVNMAILPVGYPDDPQYPNQPNLIAAQIYQAWDTLSIDVNPGEPVLVAVVDSGIDAAHEDLVGRIYTNPGETSCVNGVDDDHNGYVDDCSGWDAVNVDNAPADDNGHGTLMAGVIGAVTNNATGIAGIAPNARILPVKVLGSNGVGTHAWAAKGITYAASMGARVIYLGFAGGGNSQILSSAVTYALSKGAIVVAPAGNDNGATVNNYPASYPGVISVSAVTNAGTIAPISTRSTFISLAAPGVSVMSTARNNLYQATTGTSLAAAHVAGVFTMLAGQPQFINQPTLLTTAVLGSALDMGPVGRDSIYGYGILRANNALSFVITSSTVQITSPAASAIFAKGQAITFTGSALDQLGSNISAALTWTSDIDGPIGTGATFTVSDLTPGAHTVTASVTGGSATVYIRVMEAKGPHGEFSADTDSCILCHSGHSDAGGIDPASAGSSNAYCESCHDGRRARAVSTHSNLSAGVVGVKQEQDFELLCIQCHDPHDATTGIFAIRNNLVVGVMPTRFHSMHVQPGTLNFNSLSPSNQDALCTACHADPINPGYPMVAHEGGDIHTFLGDMTGNSCISCHYHDFDGNPATKDGFMPANPLPVTRMGASPTPTASTAIPGPVGTLTPVPTLAVTQTP